MLDVTGHNSSGNFGTSGPLTADREQVASWIEMVHGNSDGLIHISSTGNWEGRTFSDPRDATEYVMRLDADGAKGIYLRTTTLARVPRDGSRGGEEDSKVLPGFAADMDIAGPGHKPVKGSLPASVDDCYEIIQASGLPEPTLWVHSGGGVYPWWLLEEVVDISTPGMLAEAQELSGLLHETISRWAAELGCFYSPATKDMARVMRIPGTVNRKVDDDHKLAQIIQPASYTFYPAADLGSRIRLAHANSPAPAAPEMPAPVSTRVEGTAARPGDDFNDRAHWADILTPHGWTYMYHRGTTWYWRRPGKDSGEHSATTGRKGLGSEDRLYVFSDATVFDVNTPYNKFAAYAVLNHGGDFAAATRDLRSQGFGGELPQLHRTVDAVSLIKPAQVPAPVVDQAVDQQQAQETALTVQAGELLPHDDSPSRPALMLGADQDDIVGISEAIGRGVIPDLYVRDGMLVMLCPKADDAGMTVCQVNADTLNFLLAKHITTYKSGKDGMPKKASPTLSTLRAVVSAGFWPGVPPLRGVVGTPTLRPDGSLIQVPGYDKATGLFYAPTVQIKPVPEIITDKQVRTSREFVFSKVFGEFCWSTVGDFANFMALLLSPMMRPYVKTTTPFGMITATTRGSGKTNLTDAIGLLYGQSSQVLPGRGEELQKKITSILVGNASPVVVFDNIREGTSISSEILATLITKDTWDDRLLGASRNIEARNDRLWLASGNGLGVGGDMASRTVMVRLDPKMARPELRTFEMGQFSDWIREEANREELLWHLLIIVQAWMREGATTNTGHVMRGFTRWAQIMGGLLDFHGLTGFLANADDLAARDTDEEEWMVFLAKWHEIYGTQTVNAKELHASAQVEWVMGTSVDRWMRRFITDDDGLVPTPKRLGYMLRGNTDRFYGQYVLRSARNTVTNATDWWVEKREE